MHPKTLKAILVTFILCAIAFGADAIWEIPEFKNFAWIIVVVAVIIGNVTAHFWQEHNIRKKGK